MRFPDRVAIITGASRGVGRALALGLAREGCHIVVAAKSTEEDPATVEIFSRDPRRFSGHALLDETFLREQCGLSDFTRYRCDPAVEPPKVAFGFRIRAGQP